MSSHVASLPNCMLLWLAAVHLVAVYGAVATAVLNS